MFNKSSSYKGTTTTTASSSRSTAGSVITFRGIYSGEKPYSTWGCRIKVDGVESSYSDKISVTKGDFYAIGTIEITIPETCTESFSCALYNGYYYSSSGDIVWD